MTARPAARREGARTGVRIVAPLVAAVLAASGCTGGGTTGGAGGSNPTGVGATGPAVGTTGDSRPYHAGTAGLGDPYFPGYGNGGYDVGHYLVKIRYEPRTDRLTGDVTVSARATENLSAFNLDFAGLTVRSVRVDGHAAGYHRDNAELLIRPSTGLAVGGDFTVRVTYDGVPGPLASSDLGRAGFLHTDDGAFALGEPESASTWFPVNDHPLDKATYAFEITVPDGLAAISNGVPGESTRAGGWTTWRWSEAAPMASYLTTVVIGRYRVKTGEHAGKPVVTAVAASLPAGGPADRTIARTTEVADFLASQFGPYPFDAYGGVVLDDERVRYALETQSRPVYSDAFFDPAGRDASVVLAHELAHQWYGDSVSVHSWQDIWLNEGFASYAEWLWQEHIGGRSVRQAFRDEYAGTPGDVWRVAPARPGRDGIFSRSVYRRGAMALQALRETVGDEAFFRILRTWASDKRDGNATTAEFVAVAERVSGRSLRTLFDDWLYATSRPPLPG
jgi:aminopeptidase N